MAHVRVQHALAGFLAVLASRLRGFAVLKFKKREKKGNFHDLGQPVDGCEEGRSVEGSAQTVHEAAFERVVVAAGDVIPIKKDPSIDMMRGKSPFTF